MRWRGEDLAVEVEADLSDEDRHVFVIEIADGTLVGLIQFAEEQDPNYRHASVDIFVDPAMHGRGLTTDAIRTLVHDLLEDCGHHRVTIDPAADNTAAIACYRKAGFRPVDVMRQYERTRTGSWADALLMELLASDLGP